MWVVEAPYDGPRPNDLNRFCNSSQRVMTTPTNNFRLLFDLRVVSQYVDDTG
jgi:hypothetical protein